MFPTRKVFLRTIGANLRRERKLRGFSQDALAHMAGLHRTYVGSVERGERNVSAENIRRLARALGIEPADLLRRKNG
jgi:transcriptional regulator with XRE-family HTH domain